MARVVMFAYVLLAGLATPALLFAADAGSGTSTAATGAQTSAQPGSPAVGTTPAPPPTPTPAPPPAPAPPAPATQAAPTPAPAATVHAHPRRAPVLAAQPVKVRAVARAAGGDTISDFKFTPGTINVSVGETVTWSNSGPSAHTATADDGSFDTGLLNRGASGSHTFTQPGTYTFHCRPHPFMTGRVVVSAASSGGGSGSASGSAASAGGSSGSGSSGSSSSGTSAGASGGGAGSSGSNLANTGADLGAVALLGAILLGGGIVLRRRLDASS